MILCRKFKLQSGGVAIILTSLTAGCGLSPVPDQISPTKYYSAKDRQEARLQASKVSEPPVAGMFKSLAEAMRNLGDKIDGVSAVKLTNKMLDMTSADARWQGINQLVNRAYGQREPFTTMYGRVAGTIPPSEVEPDPDYLVRAVAIRALNRARDKDAAPVFLRGLSDKSDVVRLEAVKALNNLPDPAAVPGLLEMVGSSQESVDVRIAAAEALRHYKTLETAQALINVLNERDFGLAWQAHRSLQWLTASDLGYDQGKWLNYITGPAKPFG
jgi:hypothetical protein